MEMQLVEVYIPNTRFESIYEKLKEFDSQSLWVSNESEDRKLVRILVSTKDVEDVLDYLEGVAGVVDGFETMLLPVRAYFSRDTVNKAGETEEEEKQEEEEKEALLLRASRHELINNVEKSSNITLNYTMMIILSAIVATVGFIKDSEAVVIGAMVIAPMIGPVIAMAFASILGDYLRLWRAFLASIFGVFMVLLISVALGYLLDVGLKTDQYWARTEVSVSDIFLGIASGAAGALAFLNRLSGNLVGVMVAVALLPPTVALGVSLGEGLWTNAFGAFILLTLNISSILLSAVIIFSIAGIRPVRWEEVQKANVSRPLSIVFIIIMLFVLALTILFGRGI
ncbi:TIGR00341 family protein [Thalassobacillus cyri]|uniref:TIGR00341 family protein n=1 Tax=Thalassobacillus cyri TaxID=571932 RepID=A0A1H4HG54_9BACI|nr:TIGR00341 family protein [Thalassobacillus cyri]SEB20839.1 TIGR00341 family protein [Thalassobacillus cyri]